MANQTIRIKLVYKGLEYPAEISTSQSILELKGALSNTLGGLLFLCQCLKHNGQWLKNEMRVNDYQMAEGDKVYLYEGVPITITSPLYHFDLVLPYDCSVKDLKKSINSKISIAVRALVLHVGDKKMDEDDEAVWNYGVIEGSEIRLTFDIGL